MFLAGPELPIRANSGYMMVETMTGPTDPWSQDIYAPQHGSYYTQEHNSQALRLPPPSSLVNDVHYSQDAPNGNGNGNGSRRERAFHSPPSPRDVYAPVASMPAHRHAQVPNPGSDGHTSTFKSGCSKWLVDTRVRLSPTHSSTASDRSEDQPDYTPPCRSAKDPKASPPHFPSVSEAPPRQPSRVDIQPVRPSDAQLHRSHLGFPSQAGSPVHPVWPPQAEPRAPERMKISDLLSNEPSSDGLKSSTASQKAPQRNPTSTAVASTYRIHIRQQPVAARSCGYGERDRRVIDPPPIIQMSIDDPTATEEEIRSRLTHGYYIMHCTIWNEAGDQDLSSMPEDYRTQRRLMGTVVSSPFAGYDEKDEYGCFFCFPDLSCRTPGLFRLQFSFMVLNQHSMPGQRTPVVALVMSDVFTVYNAKDFPGMKASTALTKRLKEQGCLISIKKGNDRSRARDESESEDDCDEDNNGGGSNQRRLKRVKRS